MSAKELDSATIPSNGGDLSPGERNTLPEAVSKRVEGCFPAEAFKDWQALRALRDIRVIAEHQPRSNGQWLAWPGKQKNVMYWIEIEGGKAIGWNENPSSGWSFPIISYRPKTSA
jgi:hypothetical protein